MEKKMSNKDEEGIDLTKYGGNGQDKETFEVTAQLPEKEIQCTLIISDLNIVLPAEHQKLLHLLFQKTFEHFVQNYVLEEKDVSPKCIQEQKKPRKRKTRSEKSKKRN